uniref:CR-type domain-containing protein n=1 Tax=Oryza meridionalis TaxID=40149 RepID=A0A0E0DL00_9ORYZ
MAAASPASTAAAVVNTPAATGGLLLLPRARGSSWSWSCCNKDNSMGRRRRWRAAAVGEVAAEGNTYLIAGAVAVALVGTAFPILFSRKDTCPECDGAGFVRKGGATLRANAARKDLPQIVCPNCNGLGKLGQIDK